MPAPLGHQCDGATLEHAIPADHAVATAMAPRTTRAAPNGIFVDPDGIGLFERLDRRIPRVAHPDVDRVRPGAACTGSLPAAYRSIEGPAGAAEGNVVHRPLTLRRYLDTGVGQRCKDGVRDPRRHLDIPRRDG